MRAKLRSFVEPIVGAVLFLLIVIGLGLIALPYSCTNPKPVETASPQAPSATMRPPAPTGTATAPATPIPTTAPTTAAPCGVSKNCDGDPSPEPSTPPTVPGQDGQAPAPGSGPLLACGSSANNDWSIEADTLQVICECTLTVPGDGWAFVAAGGSLSGRSCEGEGHFRLGIDDRAGDATTDRWVDVYCDNGDGMDATVALSVLKPLPAGTHTFYLLGRRSAGTGAVLLHDASLSVLAWSATAQ